MTVLQIAHVHRPPTPPIYSRLPSPLLDFSFFFFFILTLINCGEIMFPSPYDGEPALHIVVLAVMNCPSGPFWSEFLMSTPEMESFRCVPGLSRAMEKRVCVTRAGRVVLPSCCLEYESVHVQMKYDALLTRLALATRRFPQSDSWTHLLLMRACVASQPPLGSRKTCSSSSFLRSQASRTDAIPCLDVGAVSGGCRVSAATRDWPPCKPGCRVHVMQAMQCLHSVRFYPARSERRCKRDVMILRLLFLPMLSHAGQRAESAHRSQPILCRGSAPHTACPPTAGSPLHCTHCTPRSKRRFNPRLACPEPCPCHPFAVEFGIFTCQRCQRPSRTRRTRDQPNHTCCPRDAMRSWTRQQQRHCAMWPD